MSELDLEAIRAALNGRHLNVVELTGIAGTLLAEVDRLREQMRERLELFDGDGLMANEPLKVRSFNRCLFLIRAGQPIHAMEEGLYLDDFAVIPRDIFEAAYTGDTKRVVEENLELHAKLLSLEEDHARLLHAVRNATHAPLVLQDEVKRQDRLAAWRSEMEEIISDLGDAEDQS